MLSERVRADVEAAPWVIDEIKKLETDKPVDPMVSLRWSSEPPTTPGWYWVESLYLNGVLEVFIRPGHSYLCILNPICCLHTKRDFLMVDKLPDIKWAGPLIPPTN